DGRFGRSRHPVLPPDRRSTGCADATLYPERGSACPADPCVHRDALGGSPTNRQRASSSDARDRWTLFLRSPAVWLGCSPFDPLMSTRKSPAARAAELRREIARHDHLYHVEGRPEISDAEYDALFQELKALESEHPDLVTPESPTQRVGAPLPEGEGFPTVAHSVPMLSIDSLFANEEVREFEARVLRFLNLEDRDLEWVVEPKPDGVSASLTYEDGRLAQGLTRGDGLSGEDITANLKTVRSIPILLARGKRAPPKLLEVRGEVVIERARFQRFNAR